MFSINREEKTRERLASNEVAPCVFPEQMEKWPITIYNCRTIHVNRVLLKLQGHLWSFSNRIMRNLSTHERALYRN
ncbi:hypothetical protein KDA_49130 [Dictyobacter alpinus]|uniref:Uncharacterized protein n=1 Tax=Dictyobacter alpinus TaxID=2014873 RepID=A0A402BDN5_9CHLR|nr:hypothetical protein KDA_49130 [Dictyobacter alpinus]